VINLVPGNALIRHIDANETSCVIHFVSRSSLSKSSGIKLRVLGGTADRMYSYEQTLVISKLLSDN
jgi:hypothetical protein